MSGFCFLPILKIIESKNYSMKEIQEARHGAIMVVSLGTMCDGWSTEFKNFKRFQQNGLV